MPTYPKEPCFCGYTGPFGFIDRVRGIMHYYHDSGGCPGYWVWQGVRYRTLKAAWEKCKESITSDRPSTKVWIAAWDAKIDGRPGRAARLFKKWREAAEAEM